MNLNEVVISRIFGEYLRGLIGGPIVNDDPAPRQDGLRQY